MSEVVFRTPSFRRRDFLSGDVADGLPATLIQAMESRVTAEAAFIAFIFWQTLR
jgi:hypothetical protein